MNAPHASVRASIDDTAFQQKVHPQRACSAISIEVDFKANRAPSLSWMRLSRKTCMGEVACPQPRTCLARRCRAAAPLRRSDGARGEDSQAMRRTRGADGCVRNALTAPQSKMRKPRFTGLSCRCSNAMLGVPKGIRTPVTTVKGSCPRPLDEGDKTFTAMRVTAPQTKTSDGGGKRDRTADLLHAMQALSQLSYTPVVAVGQQSQFQARPRV